jgi:hypothetical protein
MKRSTSNIAVGFTIFIAICIFGGCLYFVGGVSATTPPIMQYKFKGSANQFKDGLYNQLKLDTSIKYKNEETIGDKEHGYAYRITVNQCRNGFCNEYGLQYEDEKAGTRISLISAFDEGYKHGGYGIKAIGMQKLLTQFETDVLNPLKSEQKINLVRDTSFFSTFSIY